MRALFVVSHIFLFTVLYHLIAFSYNIMLEQGAFPLVGIGFFIGAFGMGFQIHGLINDYIKEKGSKRKGSGIDYI
jgi:hypothetical protein